MKFRATVVLEFQAGSIGEAGARLSEVLAAAREAGAMEARSVELRTPPGETPVTLPLSPPGAVTGPTGDGGG